MYLCGSSSSSSSTFLRNLWVGDFGLLYAKEDGLRPFENMITLSQMLMNDELTPP